MRDLSIFMTMVDSLLERGQLYLNAQQFAVNIGLLQATEPEKAMSYLQRMVEVANKAGAGGSPHGRGELLRLGLRPELREVGGEVVVHRRALLGDGGL